MAVLVLGVVDELQGVSAFTCSDLLQQLDLLGGFFTHFVSLNKVFLVDEFDSDSLMCCLVLRQNYLAKATFAQ